MRRASGRNDRIHDPEPEPHLSGEGDRSGCWIFIVVDHLIGDRRILAVDVLRDRLERKIWIVNSKNPQVKRLRKGDEVVFYVGGNRAQRGFAGIGVLALEPRPMTASEVVEYGAPSSGFDQIVELQDARMWARVKPAAELVSRLQFIRKKRRWGVYLQGGIVGLPKSDFELIIES